MSTPDSPCAANPPLVLLGVFGIAMGLLEAIVVVYLRELYFPGGFRFPLRFFSPVMLRTEMLREFSTIVMLAAVAAIAARTFILRFSVFLFTFGIWDIFYYVFLKALLDWPRSLLTWDVLFLIPVTWAGPVLAPVVCSLTMIGLGLFFIILDRSGNRVRAGKFSWLLMATGAALIVCSFLWDYGGLVIRRGLSGGLADSRGLQAAVASFVPDRYHWGLFVSGEALIVLSALAVYRGRAGNRNGPNKVR